MEEYTQFTMRMENTIYERLKESAAKNRRSIAKELEFITDSYLSDDINKRIDDIQRQLKAQSEMLHYLSGRSASQD